MLEKATERKIKKAAERNGGLFIKWTSPGYDGVPDRILLMPGREVVFVETKQDGETLSSRQRVVHRKLIGLGYEVLTIHEHQAAAFIYAYIEL